VSTKLAKPKIGFKGIDELKRTYDIKANSTKLTQGSLVFKTQMISDPSKQVAIKVIEKNKILNIKNLIQEFDFLCQSKNYLPIEYYEIYEDSNNIFLVQEYVEGRNLMKLHNIDKN